MTGMLPELASLVDAADGMLAPSIRAAVPADERRAALAEQLQWSYTVAAQDPAHAREFHAMMPVRGAREEDYRDRWLPVEDELWVLAGPRFRGLDPEMPFVEITACSRVIAESDLPALRRLGRERFARFAPRYVNLWAGLPAGSWAGTRADNRLLIGELTEMRRAARSPQFAARALTDLGFYDAYLAIYEEHRARRPALRVQARPQPADHFRELIAAGRAWSVEVGGETAGVLAAEPGVGSGCRGLRVIELVLAPPFCGHGYGPTLSLLLACSARVGDGRFLFGEIHAENRPAYRAAIAAGRRDVGGEILIDL